MTRQDELRRMVAEATPGQWETDPDPREGYEWNTHIVDYDMNRVCFMANNGGTPAHVNEASARLIAQAPALATDLADALDKIARLDRERKLAEAQVDRLLALSDSMDSDFENVVASMRDAGGRLVALYDEAMRDLLGNDVHHGNPDSEEMAEIRRVFSLPALTPEAGA